MDFERIRPVFERVFFRNLRAGKLPGLADRDETATKRVGQRCAEDVAAGLDPNDRIDVLVAVPVDEEVDRGVIAGFIAKQRGDIAKENTRNREIRYRADQ